MTSTPPAPDPDAAGAPSPASREAAAAPAPAMPSGQVQYRGAPLEPARGPGLGCFWIQVVVFVVLAVLTPLSVVWRWPEAVSAALLLLIVLLLFFTGQTVVFLLRLVAADRRAAGRRRPLASSTRTVGEIEDEHAELAGTEGAAPAQPGEDDTGPVRQ